MISQPMLEQFQAEAMPRGVTLRNRVPAAVLDGDARLVTSGFESDIDFSDLIRRECCLPPGERNPFAGFPDRNSANLEFLAIVEQRDETATLARLEAQMSVSIRRQPKQRMRAPPFADFAGKYIERTRGRGIDAQ